MAKLLFLLLSTSALARDWHGAEDSARSRWFKSLLMPQTGNSCCDVSDCHQTRAEWRAGQWWALVEGKMAPIPPERVLSTPRSIDGEAYVCNGAGYSGEGAASGPTTMQPHDPPIYCFVPPNLGN